MVSRFVLSILACAGHVRISFPFLREIAWKCGFAKRRSQNDSTKKCMNQRTNEYENVGERPHAATHRTTKCALSARICRISRRGRMLSTRLFSPKTKRFAEFWRHAWNMYQATGMSQASRTHSFKGSAAMLATHSGAIATPYLQPSHLELGRHERREQKLFVVCAQGNKQANTQWLTGKQTNLCCFETYRHTHIQTYRKTYKQTIKQSYFESF